MAERKNQDRDRRRYPRKTTQVKVRLEATGAGGLAFEAHLPSIDVSIGGIFLQSEFFIKLGTELRVHFELEQVAEPVVVTGVVVREQRATPGKRGMRSGFAIEFTEYAGDARLALATYFLAPSIRDFVGQYRKRGRHKRIRSDEDRMVDLIVAWEMDQLDQGRRAIKA